MLAAIPLTDDERAAVDDGQAALEQLLERVTDVLTSAGPTPRKVGIPAQATLLPVIEISGVACVRRKLGGPHRSRCCSHRGR